MALETNHYRVNDEGNRISRETGCGWTGVPNADGSFVVTFFDEDDDTYAWELALIFHADEEGQSFTSGGDATLSETSLTAYYETKPVAQTAKYQVDDLNSFDDVLNAVREVQGAKPKVSAIKSATNTLTKKVKSSGMGSPADIKDLLGKKLTTLTQR